MEEPTESRPVEPSSSAPRPEAPPVRFRPALGRGVDSALYAGALLALIDGALLLFRRGGTLSAAGLLVPLTLAACVPFGLLAGVLAWGGKRFEPERRAVRIGVVVVGAALCVAWVAERTLAAAEWSALARAASALGVLLVCALIVWRVVKAGVHPWLFLIGAALGLFLVRTFDNSVGMADRIFATGNALPIAAWHLGSPAGAAFLGAALARLAESLGRSPRLVAGLAPAAAGIVLALICESAGRGVYQSARTALFGIALVVLLAGCASFPGMGLRARSVLVALAAGGTLALAALSTALAPERWTIATTSEVGGTIVRRTGLLWPATLADLQRLRQLPAARVGADLGGRARAWNASPVRTPPLRSAVLITVDALRYDHVGYSGRAAAGLTPAMDALAAKSVRFHRAYAQGGWTSISLPTFMWSRNPRDIRFVPLYETPENDRFLAADLPPGTPVTAIFPAPQPEPSRSLAELLRGARIRTIVVRNDESNWPFDPALGFVRGFERIAHSPPDAGRSSLENDAEAARTAIAEIRRAGSERFFLWIHLFGPHLPFLRGPDAPRSFSDYEAEVHQVDRLVASMLAAVDEAGRGADTAIVLTADHGEELGERGGRGHGLTLFEESIRVPLLVFAPGASPRDVRETVGLTDLAPTLLGLLGLQTPGAMQGYSLRPFLQSPPARARGTSRPPVTVDTWRKDRAGTIDLHLVAAVDERHKVVLDLLTGAVAAFDLERDPSERRPTGPNAASSDTAATLAGWTRVR